MNNVVIIDQSHEKNHKENIMKENEKYEEKPRVKVTRGHYE